MRDSFGRDITYLRLSVTDRCNLRCRYCMPEEGCSRKQHDEILSFEEIVRAVRYCSELGIIKVRITGGEPLVRKNISSLCNEISKIEGIEEVCLTTNGTLLPSLAGSLRDAGVGRVNISLDTLSPDKYRMITRLGNLSDALAGLRAALDAGFTVKVNAVLIGGFNDSEIPDLASLTMKYPLDLRFIELMPMTNGFGAEAYIKSDVVLEMLPELQEEDSDGVARRFRLPGAKGRIGLISPVSDMFCSSCNRIRITSDGYVKPCLHCADEHCIKGLDDAAMRAVLREAILSKPACHAALSAERSSNAGRFMNEIGG